MYACTPLHCVTPTAVPLSASTYGRNSCHESRSHDHSWRSLYAKSTFHRSSVHRILSSPWAVGWTRDRHGHSCYRLYARSTFHKSSVTKYFDFIKDCDHKFPFFMQLNWLFFSEIVLYNINKTFSHKKFFFVAVFFHVFDSSNWLIQVIELNWKKISSNILLSLIYILCLLWADKMPYNKFILKEILLQDECRTRC